MKNKDDMETILWKRWWLIAEQIEQLYEMQKNVLSDIEKCHNIQRIPKIPLDKMLVTFKYMFNICLIMNKKDLQMRINDNVRKYLDPMKRHFIDTVAINHGNTLEHELKKAEISYNLKKMGHTICTEAPLKNGKRPDVLVLDLSTPIAYEIMKSESDDSIAKKNLTYGDIKIIEVRI